MSIAIQLDYRPEFGPVRNQAARPTCLAHAATAAHEHTRGSTVPLSPEYLHYFASKGAASSEGVDFPHISHALLNPGQPREVACPYQPDGPPPTWTPPQNLNLYRRNSAMKAPSSDQIDALLNAGHVPVLGITTPKAFFSPEPPWIISPDETVHGLHAVVAVALGIVNATRHFLIRNSWGPEWADEGHAWLDEAFMAQHLHNILVLTDEVI